MTCKILVIFLLIHLTNQVYCQKNSLEGLYNDGTKTLSTIALQQKNNITLHLKQIINNITNDLFNNRHQYFSDVPTKLRTIRELKLTALNCIECASTLQSNYEDFIYQVITKVKKCGDSFKLCSIRSNSQKDMMKCFDKTDTNENKKCDGYQRAINEIYSNNPIMISTINYCDDNCTFSLSQVESILKKNNQTAHQQGVTAPSGLPIVPSTKTQNINSCSIKSNYADEKLNNLFINQKKNLDNADLKILEALYLLTSKATFKNISQVDSISNNECCFKKFFHQISRVRSSGINEHGEYIHKKIMDFENFIDNLLQASIVRKIFDKCFDKFATPILIFKCMESSQYSGSSTVKGLHDAFVCEFQENNKTISLDIHNHSYDFLSNITQHVTNLKNQLSYCIETGKSSDTCASISIDDFYPKKLSEKNTGVLKIVEDIDSSFTDTS